MVLNMMLPMGNEAIKCVVEVRNLSLEYVRRDRAGRCLETVRALNSADLGVEPGAAIGLAGGSGSGKSTLVRCLAGWLEPSSGQVLRTGEVQLVMQDPGASLNPRFTAREIVEEPLRLRGGAIPNEMSTSALASVGICPSRLAEPGSSFSGGERARLAVARSLAAFVKPSSALLVLDESLGNLDPSTTDIILDLLATLRREKGLALMMISHDLGLLRSSVTELCIMHEGKIVERGELNSVVTSPRHEFSARLVDAMLREA